MAPKAKPAAAQKAAAKPVAAKASEAYMKKREEERQRPEDLIPKVEWPKKEDFDAKLQGVQDEIDKLQKQQQDLAKQISERSGGKDEYQQKRAELRAELDHWSGLLDGCRTQKEEIKTALGEKREEGAQAKADLNKMKKSIGFTSETEIDERIAAIEFKMHHSSVSLKDEKKMMEEIKQLKKDRPKVAGIKKMESSLQGGDGGASLKETSKAIGETMGRYIEEKRKVSEKLKELNESRKAETGDLPDLIEKREVLSGKIRELSGKRQEIRKEQRELEQAYWAYQAEVRKIRQERAGQEREARQKEYELEKRHREAAKLDDQPHIAEITLIDQTIAFCKTFDKKETEAKEEKKEIVHANLDGIEVMATKKDRHDEEVYFVNPKSKKKGKAKGAKSEGGSAKSIKHSAETFQLFSKLKLDAPITTDDIPDLLEKLEAQLVEYKEKVKVWEEKRDDMKKRILEGEAADEEAQEEEEAAKADE